MYAVIPLACQSTDYSDYIYNICLDWKILVILIKRSLERPDSFYGLSIKNILHLVNGFGLRGKLDFSREQVSEVKRALRTLERHDPPLIYSISASRKNRYFPSSLVVAAYGFADGDFRRMWDFL